MIKLKHLLEGVNSKVYYHVSPNKFKPGDIIQPYFDPNKYADETDTSADSRLTMKAVEDVLNNARTSDSPLRTKSIFIFKSLSDAKQYVKDMGDNRHIYTVSSTDKIKWHDMNWVDYIFSKLAAWGGGRGVKNINQIPKEELLSIEDYAKKYWMGWGAQAYTYAKTKWEGITNSPIKVIEVL